MHVNETPAATVLAPMQLPAIEMQIKAINDNLGDCHSLATFITEKANKLMTMPEKGVGGEAPDTEDSVYGNLASLTQKSYGLYVRLQVICDHLNSII